MAIIFQFVVRKILPTSTNPWAPLIVVRYTPASPPGATIARSYIPTGRNDFQRFPILRKIHSVDYTNVYLANESDVANRVNVAPKTRRVFGTFIIHSHPSRDKDSRTNVKLFDFDICWTTRLTVDNGFSTLW